MANNLIQIKRSNSTASPTTTLNAGELAYSYNSNALYIGAQTGIGATGVQIAGSKYSYLNSVTTPGQTAATAALVTDANSFTSALYTNNFWVGATSSSVTTPITSITNSGSSSGLGATPATGQANELATTFAIVSYVSTKIAGGAVNTSAQYTFSNTIAFTANVSIGGSAVSELLVGNTTTVTTVNSSVIVLASNSTTSATINSSSYSGSANNAAYLGGTAAASYQLTGALLSANVAQLTSNNSSYLGGVISSSYQLTGALLSANVAQLTSNNSSFLLGQTWNAPGAIGLSTPNTANFTTANASTLQVGTSFIANSTQVTFTGQNITATGASASLVNLTLSGNLTVSGTTTTINTTSLNVNDNLIFLADNNNLSPTDSVDIGFVGIANTAGANTYYGLARVAAQNQFTLFSSTTINEGAASTIGAVTTMPLQAYLIPYGPTGAFVANSTSITLTANTTLPVNITANTISLTSALGVGSGGTGLTSIPVGTILLGNTTGVMTQLAVPGSSANGQVLQIVNNIPAYGTLDGGSF